MGEPLKVESVGKPGVEGGLGVRQIVTHWEGKGCASLQGMDVALEWGGQGGERSIKTTQSRHRFQ